MRDNVPNGQDDPEETGRPAPLRLPQFPSTGKYENSEEAAEAAECASAQGKFWEMHDCMFENQSAFDELHLARYATDLGLDLRKSRREMRKHVHRAKIRTGRNAGVRRGIVQAPTLFIDCSVHESAFGLSTLLAAVQAAAGDSAGRSGVSSGEAFSASR